MYCFLFPQSVCTVLRNTRDPASFVTFTTQPPSYGIVEEGRKRRPVRLTAKSYFLSFFFASDR